jgi:hypothetical protein
MAYDWGRTMSAYSDIVSDGGMDPRNIKPAIYIMKNVDGRLWYWDGKNDKPEEHMLEALSEESLEKAIVAIRAHIAEMGEITKPKPTKLLLQPGLLKELGLTVKDVVKMIAKQPKVARLPTAQHDLMGNPGKPYAWVDGNSRIQSRQIDPLVDIPLYTKQEWQGLTDEERAEIAKSDPYRPTEMMKLTEQALKEKNGG